MLLKRLDLQQILLVVVVALSPFHLVADESKERCSLGFAYTDIGAMKESLEATGSKIPVAKGAMVIRVIPNSPAEGKIAAFDIITSVGKEKISSADELKEVLSKLEPDQMVDVRGFGSQKVGNKLVWKKANVKVKAKPSKTIYLESLEKKTDAITEVTTYESSLTPRALDKESLSCLILQPKDGEPRLMLSMHYSGDDWLFVQEMVVKTQSETTTVDFLRGELETEVLGGGKVAEWSTKEVDSKILKMLLSASAPGATTVRLNGKTFHRDRELSATEKLAMRCVLNAYDAMVNAASPVESTE